MKLILNNIQSFKILVIWNIISKITECNTQNNLVNTMV